MGTMALINDVPLDGVPPEGPVALPPNGFIPRNAQFAELDALLRRGRLVTLTGPPGAGKSRLLVEYLIRSGLDASWFVDLTEAAAGADVSAALVTAAAGASGRGTLLVLDGCDHVIGSCVRAISALLRTDSTLRVLATSREAFRIAGESVCPVPPLDPGEAVTLFTLRMAERNSSVTGVDGAVLEEICGQLDRLPLAIELAAASCDVMSPGDLLRRLDGRIEVLAGGDRSGPARQQSLAAALDWSFDLLDDAERVLLGRLACFAGTFSLDDAERVCAGGGFDGHAIFAGIAALAGKSLVGCEMTGATVRYFLLTTVRAAVRSASWAQPGLAATRLEHVRWCTALAEAAWPDGGGAADLSRGLDRITDHYGDMAQALSWCRSQAPGAGRRLALALSMFWQVRGPIEEGCRWFADLLDVGEGEGEGRVRLEYGVLLYAGGEFAQARTCAEEALRRFETGSDQPGRIRALMLLDSVRVLTDRPVGGRLLDEIAKHAADGAGWSGGAAAALLGTAQAFTGDLTAARRALLACAGAAGHPLVRLAAQIALGRVLLDQGDFPDAQQAMDRARELSYELRYPQGIALADQGLAAVAAAVGRHDEARARLAQAVTAARACGTPAVLACCLNEQARLLAEDDAAAARPVFRRVLDMAGAIPAREVATALLGAARADLAGGDAAAGRALAEEAAVLARRVGDKTMTARALHAQGLASRLAGQGAAAWSLLREALAIRAEVGAVPGIAESLEALAGVCASQGRRREAGELFGAADRLRTRLGVVLGPAAADVHARDIALAQAGGAEFEHGWAEGIGQRTEDTVAQALSRESRRAAATGWAALTRAELEVARLAAEGLTNREIGARLFVSPRTVQTHLSHVFGKLELASRRELTREMRTRTRSLGMATEASLRRVLGLPHETPGAGPAALGGGWRPAAIAWPAR